MRLLSGLSVFAILLLAGCGDGDAGSAGAPDPSSSSETSTSQSPKESIQPEPITDPMEAAAALKAEIPQIGKIIEITEANDANDLLGRPGQYDAGSFMEDKRLGCSGPSFDELSIDCGAKIERWGSQDDAQARADDIQQKLKDFGLGAEWDYVKGRLLLRVAGALKPTEAKIYEDTFNALP